jgi:RNA polymerase sigma factor (sigma-70 family)
VASAATLTHGDAISFAIDDDKRQREKAVVRAAQGGDRSAFEELYKENVRRVYALAYRLTGNPNDAEELTQEAFIRAWQKLSSFRHESAFSTWLYRLGVNTALMDLRGRREARVMPVEDLTPFDGGAPEETPGWGRHRARARAAERRAPGVRAARRLRLQARRDRNLDRRRGRDLEGAAPSSAPAAAEALQS